MRLFRFVGIFTLLITLIISFGLSTAAPSNGYGQMSSFGTYTGLHSPSSSGPSTYHPTSHTPYNPGHHHPSPHPSPYPGPYTPSYPYNKPDEHHVVYPVSPINPPDGAASKDCSPFTGKWAIKFFVGQEPPKPNAYMKVMQDPSDPRLCVGTYNYNDGSISGYSYDGKTLDGDWTEKDNGGKFRFFIDGPGHFSGTYGGSSGINPVKQWVGKRIWG
jgi:hypothetical protein